MTDTPDTPDAVPALLLDNDLFFVAKVTGMLKHAGYATRTVRTTADFARTVRDGRFAVALVNTAARGVEWQPAIATAREAGVPVIAYCPHVDVETQAAARKAGATRVITNSKLATDLPQIVARTVRRSPDLDRSAPKNALAHDETQSGDDHPPARAPLASES